MIATIISLAWKSLSARKTTAFLTIVAVALSVALFLGVEKTRHAARASFENTISDVDAIVGGRTGPINLLLFSVFRIGDATSPISWNAYQAISNRPDVAWTVPISLGDSHKGFRVLGTSPAYFEHYKYGDKQNLAFKSGHTFDPHALDVVLGAKVAQTLGYDLNTELTLSHGVGKVSFHEHDKQHFTVVGILAATGTPVDQTVHVSLEAIERMHAAPTLPEAIHSGAVHEEHHDHETHEGHNEHAAQIDHEHHDARHDHLEPKSLNAVFVGLKSPGAVLRFNREVNTYPKEALLSIIPGMTLSSLWSIVGSAENALKAISIFVIFVGLATILISIFTSLNERRREMAILRSMGARPLHIFSLIMAEAGLLAFAGAVIGILLTYLLLAFLAPWIGNQYGLQLTGWGFGQFEIMTVLIVTLSSGLMSLWPATRAMKSALSDGLSVRA